MHIHSSASKWKCQSFERGARLWSDGWGAEWQWNPGQLLIDKNFYPFKIKMKSKRKKWEKSLGAAMKLERGVRVWSTYPAARQQFDSVGWMDGGGWCSTDWKTLGCSSAHTYEPRSRDPIDVAYSVDAHNSPATTTTREMEGKGDSWGEGRKGVRRGVEGDRPTVRSHHGNGDDTGVPLLDGTDRLRQSRERLLIALVARPPSPRTHTHTHTHSITCRDALS